jgi:hypothetical protein
MPMSKKPPKPTDAPLTELAIIYKSAVKVLFDRNDLDGASAYADTAAMLLELAGFRAVDETLRS